MDVKNTSNGNIFPREPRGNQSQSVQKAQQQLNTTFSSTTSTNNISSPIKGRSINNSVLIALLNLILKLLSSLGVKNTTPPEDEGARGVYGGAIAAPPEDEGARGVYGSPVGIPSSQDG